jgi:hypothetical protein
MGRRAISGPRVIVLRCEECGLLVGSRGHLAVDRIAAMERRAGIASTGRDGQCRSSVGTLDRTISWRIVHAGCDEPPKPSDYRISSARFTTTGDLLEATAHLMAREPWVIETNWSGLIGRILADTRRVADSCRSTETPHPPQTAKPKDRRLADPDDPRHGTLTGYTNYGCRCERCKAANTEQRQRDRARRNGQMAEASESTETSEGHDDD